MNNQKNDVYQVSQLNKSVKNLLEQSYKKIKVEGELSNLSRPASGHIYFSLKDEKAQIACALFKQSRNNLKIPQDALKNGEKIIATGKVSLYEASGNYQIIAEQIELTGTGSLELLFKQRFAELEKAGWFDAKHKKPIPLRPKTIGVITSASGAALHDVLNTLQRRNKHIEVIIYPSLVQGELASANLIKQITHANQQQKCDVLLLVRGGGSLEDLWEYNSPELIINIANSTIPIISGIGHQTDTTLADFAADLRAATPTAAAEQACQALQEIINQSQQNLLLINQKLNQIIKQKIINLDYLKLSLINQSPQNQLKNNHQLTNQLKNRLNQAITQIYKQQKTILPTIDQQLNKQINLYQKQKEQQFANYIQQLELLSPLKILKRGYAIASQKNGATIQKTSQVKAREKITIRIEDGFLDCTISQISDLKNNLLDHAKKTNNNKSNKQKNLI